MPSVFVRPWTSWFLFLLATVLACSSTVHSVGDATDARTDASTPDTFRDALDPSIDHVTEDIHPADTTPDRPDAVASDTNGDRPDAMTCPPPPACDAEPPSLTADMRRPRRHFWPWGDPHHRGRDLFLRERDPQWAIAKFAYGWIDDDLQDEWVEVYVLRDCRTWERLGTVLTTQDSDSITVEGVENTGGRVYFQIPPDRRLGVGRHRVHFIVHGDLSTTDAYITVLPAGARIVVTDVDGTLTESENAEFRALFTGASPAANPGAPEVLWALARRGYYVFYLTARPEWLAPRTHQWLTERGFPPGIVHTTLGLTGATGAPAERFKTEELQALRMRVGDPPDYAFGNTVTDVGAYSNTGIDPRRSYYYRLMGEDLRGGQYLDDYRTLIAPLSMGPQVCR